MVQSPSREANRPTNSQIPRILWNQDVRYRIYKKQPIVRVLSGKNSFHILSSFFTIHFNPLNAELNPICHLLALLGTHPILHVSRIKVNITISAKETDTELVSELHYPLSLHYALYTSRHCRIVLSAVCLWILQNCIIRCLSVDIAELHYPLLVSRYCRTTLSAAHQ